MPDSETKDVIRTVIMRKLRETEEEIVKESVRKAERLKKILDEYGSVQAYKDYLLELKR